MSEPNPTHKLARAKRVREKFMVSADFAPLLFPGDSVTGQSIKAYKNSDRNDDATAAVLETPGNEGDVLKVRFKAGDDGANYLIDFEATTDGGDVIVQTLLASVRGA